MTYTFVDVRNFTPAWRQWTTLGAVTGITRSGNTLTLQMDQGPHPILQILTPTMFRLRFNARSDYAADHSVAVVQTDFGPPVAINVVDQRAAYSVDTGEIRIVITKNPYALSVYRGSQRIHADPPAYNIVYIPGESVVANFKQIPPNALYVGFGEKAGATLAKNQYTMTQFNFDNFIYAEPFVPLGTDAGPLNPSVPLYASVPLLIETNPAPGDGPRYSYGLFFDNPAQTYFNIGASDYADMSGLYYLGALYGDLNTYFIFGPEVADVVRQYVTLTGFAPMPPRYVFGYHQGCYGYYSKDIALDVARRLRAARIPTDGLHLDVDFQNNYRTFTHSEMKFPGADQMFADLRNMGFKCSTNITPLVTSNPLDEHGNFADYATAESGKEQGFFLFNTHAGEGPNPDRFQGIVSYGNNLGSNPFQSPVSTPRSDPSQLGSTGYYPDLGRPEVSRWWGEQYRHLLDLGLEMIWQDMTCPALANTPATPVHTFPLDLMISYGGDYVPAAVAHNAYPLMLLRATWDGLRRLSPQRRHFIIARGGYAGMQRYAGLWTGDSASSWDFLAINVPEVLNLGLSGIPISGCDIGGFANGSASTPSNYYLGPDRKIVGCITDYQLLTRWMQLGSFLPWYRNHYNGYTKQFQEPYMYGEPVPTNCRKYIELRYRMMDLYYSAMWECTLTGMPIARALFLNDPDDPGVYGHLNDQFFVGKDFLVAPIVTPSWTRSVYLPAGWQWYAFKDNRAPLDAPVGGGTLIDNWYAPLDTVPIYVRAGAVLPTRELEQWVGQLDQNPVTFNIYPGAAGSFDLYEDDGITVDGPHRVTRVRHHAIAGGEEVTVEPEGDYRPPEKFYFVTLLGSRSPAAVKVNGQSLPDAGSSEALWNASKNSYYYNSEIQQTFAKIFDQGAAVTIQILS